VKNNTFKVDEIIGLVGFIDVSHYEAHEGHLYSAIHATSVGNRCPYSVHKSDRRV
jgi:hypothetical protein